MSYTLILTLQFKGYANSKKIRGGGFATYVDLLVAVPVALVLASLSRCLVELPLLSFLYGFYRSRENPKSLASSQR